MTRAAREKRNKEMYDLRRGNKDGWQIIATKFGMSYYGALKAARRHARETGQHWPIPATTMQERCYKARETGQSWQAVCNDLGIACPNVARRAANRYALRHGKNWPLPEIKG